MEKKLNSKKQWKNNFQKQWNNFQKKWNEFKKWWSGLRTLQKTAFILFWVTVFMMVFGLIFIGAVKGGFYALHKYGVATVLQFSSYELMVENLGVLQFGTVVAAILTPLVLVATVFVFGLDTYLQNYKSDKQAKEQVVAVEVEKNEQK